MLGQLGQGPPVFADELIGNIPLLHLNGQHFPCVGFHLDVRTDRRFGTEHANSCFQLIGCRVKQAARRAV